MMDIKKSRLIFLSVLILITAALCTAAFYLGSKAAIHRTAANRLKLEIETKQAEYDSLTEEKSILESDITAYGSQADANSDMNVRMKEHEERTASLTAEIEAEKNKSAELDYRLSELKKTSSRTEADAPKQTLRTLKADTYSCPNDIEAGSYTLSAAEGNIIIYGSDNSIRVSKSLSMIDGNEYTVQIKDGEKLKVDKDVSVKGTGKINKNQTR